MQYKPQKTFYLIFSKTHNTLSIPKDHWWPEILKVRHDRKETILLIAKKNTYIEVNTSSAHQI